jgi:glutaredoxin-like YruB-family protein
MTRICPKCHYARKPTDDCPEWQCPSCQIAYNKAADVGGMQMIPARREAAQEAGAGAMKWVVLALIVCAAVVFGSALMKTSKRSGQPSGQIIGEAQAGQPEVVMYSTSWCGYCRAARNFFQANGIQYVELDIEKSREANSTHKKLGGRGVPLITVGDDVVNGYNQARLQQLLEPWMTRS